MNYSNMPDNLSDIFKTEDAAKIMRDTLIENLPGHKVRVTGKPYAIEPRRADTAIAKAKIEAENWDREHAKAGWGLGA
jgi:hypothetical protein